MLTPSLRTSGFLFALPPEELQSFLLLLTFVTAEGHIAPYLWQLAEALGQSETKTRARLERLLKAQWMEQHIVAKHGGGADRPFYSPIHGLLPLREEGNKEPPQVIYQATPREVIIEQSRRLYARPRAEVEAEIAQFLSKSPLTPPPIKSKKPSKTAMTYQEPTPQLSPQDEAHNQLRDALIQAGLYPEQADELLAEYDHERIQRQLAWLPYRGARNPAGMLMAAIRGDYEAPPAVRPTPIAPPPETLTETPLDTTALEVPHAE